MARESGGVAREWNLNKEPSRESGGVAREWNLIRSRHVSQGVWPGSGI